MGVNIFIHFSVQNMIYDNIHYYSSLHRRKRSYYMC